MHESELINQFVELRVQGLSVPKISQQIGVPPSTLYDWNERARPRIHKLRLIMLEQAEEHILGAPHDQYQALAKYLKAIDQEVASEIDKGVVENLTFPELIRLGASLRRQLYRLKVHVTDPLREHKSRVYADPPVPNIQPVVDGASTEPKPKP